MLNHLRHFKKWVMYLVLILIVGGLVLVFGYNMAPSMGGTGPNLKAAIKINGEQVSQALFNFQLENYLDRQAQLYTQLLKQELPPNFKQQAQQSLIEESIQKKLLVQQAYLAGMSISDKELGDYLLKMPELKNADGFFDKQRYIKQIKPAYFAQTGANLEDVLREELLNQKFEDYLRSLQVVSENDLKKQYFLENTKIKILKLSYKLPSDKSETQADKKIVPEELEADLKAYLLEENKTKSNLLLQGLKKKYPDYNIASEETALTPLSQTLSLLGSTEGKGEAEDCLFKLNLNTPLCDKSYSFAGQKFFFKLIQKEDANWQNYAQEKNNLKNNLLGSRQREALKLITQELKKKATIQIYIKS